MIIKLNDGEKSHTGKPFKKDEVKEMVNAYRKLIDPDKDLKFAHFTVYEILELFVDNKIIPKAVLSQINKPSETTEYGVKIYIGRHSTERTCPTGRINDYLNRNTAIICNTEILGFKKYLDILDNTKSISMAVPGPGDAIDQATICPPDCPEGTYTNPSDGYDVGNA